jgi:threonine-phosphate decarboxylase
LILSEKTRCRQLIEKSHKFKLYPSYSNFYLLKILDEGVDAHMLFERAIRQGMMIRDCSTFPGLKERFIRFCIMKPEDNTRLINCLTQ